MSLLNRSIVSKSRKVVLPGIYIKELKPLSSLITPRLLIVPMFLVANLAQITEDLKGVLSSKEVQKLPSVKFYSRLLSSGLSTTSLSLLQSIARTLGSEFEVLSVLNSYERTKFLKELHIKLLNYQSLEPATSIGAYNFGDPVSLFKYRRSVALQTRSTMISTAIFSSHSTVVGLSIKEVNLDVILDSSKFLWSLLGLDLNEFDFLLHKEAFSCLRNFDSKLSISKVLNSQVSLSTIIYDELSKFSKFENNLVFSEDLVVLRGENNLTALESSLGFIERSIPSLPNDVYISESELDDEILRTSFHQRRSYKLKIDNIYKLVGKSFNKRFNPNI